MENIQQKIELLFFNHIISVSGIIEDEGEFNVPLEYDNNIRYTFTDTNEYGSRSLSEQQKLKFIKVKKIIYFLISLPFLAFSGEFQEDSIKTSSLDSISSSQDPEIASYLEKINRVASMKYQTEIIDLGDDVATLNVPEGYKFLNSEDSKYVLTELWGNLPSETFGLIFPDSATPLNCSNTFVISLSYDESGYIEDDDAEDLDYQEILEGLNILGQQEPHLASEIYIELKRKF